MGGHALVSARPDDHLLPSHADHRRGRRGDAHALGLPVRTAAPPLDRRQRRHRERAAREHPSRRTRDRSQRADGLQDSAAEAKRMGARRAGPRPDEGGQTLPLARGRRLVACALPRRASGVGRLGERRVLPEAREAQLGGRDASQGQLARLGTASRVRVLRPDGARLSRDLPQRSEWITRILEIRPQDARERVGNRSARHRAGAAAPRLRRRTRAGIEAFQISDEVGHLPLLRGRRSRLRAAAPSARTAPARRERRDLGLGRTVGGARHQRGELGARRLQRKGQDA